MEGGVTATTAYKFLEPGRVAPFSRRVWPADGTWVRSSNGSGEACRDAVHACRVRDLPMWMRPELWQVELEGEVTEHDTKISAPAGRLVRRIEGWDESAADRFKVECAFRARAHVVLAMGGPDGEAAELAAASTLPEIEAIAAALEEHGSERARRAAGYAKDAANMAGWEWPATLGFIAAHAAEHAGGAEAMAAERAWQAHWLAERLGLDER
jgi:hypothetical protein